MSNIYYDPEKFGLTPVGEIEWSSGAYEFDTTVVWRRNSDRALLVARDSGCSCPLPFESVGVDDCKVVTVAELGDHLKAERAELYDWRLEERGDEIDAQIVHLLGRAVSS